MTPARVSVFTGPLRWKKTGRPKLCDQCKKARAMWVTAGKRGKDVHLCFGCGNY